MLRFGRKSAKPSVITLADRARDAGQWELAAQLYQKALDRNHLNPPIWVQYGHALKESGELRDPEKLAQAEVAYRTALSLDPGVADSYLQLGHILKIQGKIDDARGAYLLAFALDPSLNDASFELAQLGSEAHFSEQRGMAGTDIADPPALATANSALPGHSVIQASHARTWRTSDVSEIDLLLEEIRAAGPAQLNPLRKFKRELIHNLGVEGTFAVYRRLGLPSSDRIRLAHVQSQHEYAKAHAETFVEIEPGGENFVVDPPRVIGGGSSRPLRNTARSLYLACLPDARVRGRSAAIQIDGQALFDYQGSALTRRNWDLDLDPSVLQAIRDRVWLIEPEDSSDSMELEAAFTLQGINTGAFGDWMMHFLPKYIAGDLSGALPKVPVLVPELPGTIHQSLKLMLAPGVEVISLPCFATARVRHLWCVPNLSCTELREKLDEPFDFGTLAPPPHRFARITAEIARRATPHLADARGPERVFLARRGSSWRKLVNQAEIADLAQANGFTVAYPEELSFLDQVALVRDARYVIAPEGSAIFLCYFARKGMKLCILNHTLLDWPTVYNSLLSGPSVDITILTGPIVRQYGPHSVNSDYHIDGIGFMKFLRELFLE